MTEQWTAYDGKLYREVERNAKENERIKMVTDCPCNGYKIGDVFVAICASSDGIVNFFDKDGDRRSKGPKCYVVLEPIESNVPDRLTALEQRVAALESQLSQISHVSVEMVRQQSEPCYTREQVIEMAKKDVEELPHDFVHGQRRYRDAHDFWHSIKFVVNRKKRTVVAIQVGVITGATFNRGIAHCAPDDCFNVHIGKAIALRRALGLDVPDYYTNAPKPTKAQVGDIGYLCNIRRNITLMDEYEAREHTSQMYEGITTLLDDSHDFGDEEV